jgi:magnesium transporter
VLPFIGVSDKTAGQPPGSAIYIGDTEPTRATLSLYSYDQQSWRMECPVAAPILIDLLSPDRINWVNINGLSGGAVESICGHLGIHPLVIEDILNTEHRPKIETFPDHVFIIIKMISPLDGGGMDYEQMSFILKGNTLVTIQERPGDCFKQVRDRIVSGLGRLRQKGADYLMYALLDLIVDNYFIVLEKLGDRLESYENMATEAAESRQFMVGLQEIKAEFLRMRRTVWPVRDMVSTLMRLDTEQIGEELSPYLRDLHENMVQSLEALETYREYTAGLVDIYLSSVNNRMGEVMKVLTIISTIFIPLTFIAGVYGMNFEFMPELGKTWGYPVVLGAMILVALGELIYFRKKKWI